jgi:hypothetical protein
LSRALRPQEADGLSPQLHGQGYREDAGVTNKANLAFPTALPCPKGFFLVVTVEGPLLSSRGQRARILLNIVYHTGGTHRENHPTHCHPAMVRNTGLELSALSASNMKPAGGRVGSHRRGA